MYTLFYLEDTANNEDEVQGGEAPDIIQITHQDVDVDHGCRSRIRLICSKIIFGFKKMLKTLSEGFLTVLKKRPYNDRFCLIMMIIAFLSEMLTQYQWVNFFMYYRLRMNFTMEDFSLLMSLAGFVGLSGQFIFVPLFCNVLKFHDATISLLGKHYSQNTLSKSLS